MLNKIKLYLSKLNTSKKVKLPLSSKELSYYGEEVLGYRYEYPVRRFYHQEDQSTCIQNVKDKVEFRVGRNYILFIDGFGNHYFHTINEMTITMNTPSGSVKLENGLTCTDTDKNIFYTNTLTKEEVVEVATVYFKKYRSVLKQTQYIPNLGDFHLN